MHFGLLERIFWQHFSSLHAMQMTVRYVLEVGDMVKTNQIQFGFCCFANLGLLGLLPFSALFATHMHIYLLANML